MPPVYVFMKRCSRGTSLGCMLILIKRHFNLQTLSNYLLPMKLCPEVKYIIPFLSFQFHQINCLLDFIHVGSTLLFQRF